MLTARLLSVLLLLVISALLAWHFAGDRRYLNPSDMAARRRRFRFAWEVRGLVAGVAGPCAAGIYLGYVPTDYSVPLLLFVAAGFLVAEMIAPSGLYKHR